MYILDRPSLASDSGAMVGAGEGSSSDVGLPASAPVYKVRGRSSEMRRALEEAGAMSGGLQAEGPMDAGDMMQAAEYAYHLNLVELLM